MGKYQLQPSRHYHWMWVEVIIVYKLKGKVLIVSWPVNIPVGANRGWNRDHSLSWSWKSWDQNRILPQQSAPDRDERVVIYPNVSARIRSSQIGSPDHDNPVLDRDNHIRTYVILSERATLS